MPKGPQGQKRPADVTRNAVHVMRIATGEVAEDLPQKRGQAGGKVGGAKRAKKLSAEDRRKIAESGARARWGKKSSTDI